MQTCFWAKSFLVLAKTPIPSSRKRNAIGVLT
jgi:hypothetical protein